MSRNAHVAETALHHGIDPGAPGERYQVVVHVDASVLADADAPGQSVLDDGAHVSAETSQRLACDASRVVMRHDPDGRILEVGARTRTIPPALRRALQHRTVERVVMVEIDVRKFGMKDVTFERVGLQPGGVVRTATLEGPREIRRSRRPVLLAEVLLSGPALIAYSAGVRQPSVAATFIPAGMLDRAEEGVRRAREGTGYIPEPQIFRPTMASAIIANNVVMGGHVEIGENAVHGSDSVDSAKREIALWFPSCSAQVSRRRSAVAKSICLVGGVGSPDRQVGSG